MPVGGSMARTSTRAPSPTRLETTAWPAGPGRGAGGRRQSQRAQAPQAPPDWRPPRGLRGQAAVPEGGSMARANNKPTHRATSATWHHWCGGRRRDRRAWSRCRWVAAGPGRASRSTTPSRQARVWRSRGRAAAHRHTQRPAPSRQATRRPEIRWCPEHPWGHKQQHAGTNGEWAGRRPPAHTAARPFKAGHTAPGTPVGPQATPEIRRVRKRHRHNGRKETPTAPGTP